LSAGPILEDVRKLLVLQYPEREFDIEWISLAPMASVHIGDLLTLAAIPNSHTVPCFGARVDAGNSAVGFTSDTAPTIEHGEAYAGCSLLIGECFALAEDAGPSLHQRGHSSAEDLARLADAAEVPIVIPFHFDERYRSERTRGLLMDRCSLADTTEVVDPVANPVYVVR
jgi:ribonuclease BN (tRNA processing enzyme)